MVKKISKSAQLKSKLSKAIIDTIEGMGGSASRKDIIKAIGSSQNFDTWEAEVLRSNKKRWVTVLDIESAELAKSGQLIKKNGVWEIVNESFKTDTDADLFISEYRSSKFVKEPFSFDDDLIANDLNHERDDAFGETYQEGLDEPTWMQVFRGKVNPHPEDVQANEAKMLRNAFITYDRKKSIELIDTNKKFDEFSEKLMDMQQPQVASAQSKKELSWWALIKMVFVLISGLVVGMMIPMQVATRGSSESLISKISSEFKSGDQINSEVTLFDDNPLTLSKNIIFTCVSSGVEVKVISNGDIQLIVYGLKKLDDKQNTLKILMEQSPEAEGNFKVTIKKK